MDLITILFLGLAVLIVWKLRSVLGQRTGTERPPIDLSRRENGAASDKVVPLPQRGPRPVDAQPHMGEAMTDARGGFPAGSAVGQALQAVMRADRTFNADHFLSGAKMAYEMIVNAFAAGDRNTLKPLLSKEVYEGFDGAIAEREKARHTVESSFVGIDSAEITEAALRGGTAQITVRFVSKLIQATRNADGAVIDGDPVRVTEVTDVWTFAKEVSARDPNWRLVATEAA